jgi:hypothetical protein
MTQSFDTGVAGKPARLFKIRFTERIYRLHQTGIQNHAPRGGGIFELVAFPRGAEDGTVLYVGHEPQGGSIAGVLQGVFDGTGGLPPGKLAQAREQLADLYHDAVLVADCQGEEDWTDLAWALVQSKKPPLNDPAAQPQSGRYSSIGYEELPAA